MPRRNFSKFFFLQSALEDEPVPAPPRDERRLDASVLALFTPVAPKTAVIPVPVLNISSDVLGLTTAEREVSLSRTPDGFQINAVVVPKRTPSPEAKVLGHHEPLTQNIEQNVTLSGGGVTIVTRQLTSYTASGVEGVTTTEGEEKRADRKSPDAKSGDAFATLSGSVTQIYDQKGMTVSRHTEKDLSYADGSLVSHISEDVKLKDGVMTEMSSNRQTISRNGDVVTTVGLQETVTYDAGRVDTAHTNFNTEDTTGRSSLQTTFVKRSKDGTYNVDEDVQNSFPADDHGAEAAKVNIHTSKVSMDPHGSQVLSGSSLMQETGRPDLPSLFDPVRQVWHYVTQDPEKIPAWNKELVEPPAHDVPGPEAALKTPKSIGRLARSMLPSA